MIPAKLRPGDTIAVFSPSSPATAPAAARYRRGKEYLEAKGFRFLEGSLTGRRDFYRSGTIRERAEEFNALVRDPEQARAFGQAGRRRCIEEFSWLQVAQQTLDIYRSVCS